jgi:glycosyltransferase involved in cell wall biosynthesis
VHAHSDDRIRHIDTTERRGPSGARNIGLDHATTALVAFMDSDDVWLRDKLTVQLQRLREAQRRDPSVAIAGCAWRGYTDDAPSRTFPVGPHSRTQVLKGMVSGLGTPMILVDRSVAAEDARFDENLPALVDRDYVLACLANGTSVIVAPEMLALVRRGRADHVATAKRAAIAYEHLLEKYANEIAQVRGLRSWYAYRAAREHMLDGNVRRGVRHLSVSLTRHPIKRAVHLSCAAVGRRKGLAVAERMLPLAEAGL